MQDVGAGTHDQRRQSTEETAREHEGDERAKWAVGMRPTEPRDGFTSWLLGRSSWPGRRGFLDYEPSFPPRAAHAICSAAARALSAARAEPTSFRLQPERAEPQVFAALFVNVGNAHFARHFLDAAKTGNAQVLGHRVQLDGDARDLDCRGFELVPGFLQRVSRAHLLGRVVEAHRARPSAVMSTVHAWGARAAGNRLWVVLACFQL